MRHVATALTLLLLAACVPPPDQPAHYTRMGRFMGLVANCGCSDIGAERMIAEYRKALGDLYPAGEVAAMKGYVDLGAGETWENQIQICAEVCAQRCMVQAVAAPLGGRGTGEKPCLVSERDLHLTDGAQINPGGDF
ncbi:hypothetical protein H261_09282 [Paramagnetospirillum caucaseum]|uniref:Lipoprotein n=1 Tax=Paramagnetospirillum caucaseum TaxID=1244869 RepID=M2Z7E8_9PROT|nr:hypothetical protein [Paramagnetospirillum caucaseum]EME70240.1 hypothetical protein H261_09282 [Paramagnetospirillum caucaseum]